MTSEEFKGPLKYLRGALGGDPKDPLLEWLYGYYMASLELEVWKRACHSIAHGMKPAHMLVGQDFIRAVSEARSAMAHEAQRKDAHEECRQDHPAPIKDSITTMAEVGSKTGSPFLSRLAEDLRKRREGEKPKTEEMPPNEMPF